MDVEIIEKVVNEIYSGGYSELHSLLIDKDGKLVFEEYFQGHKYQWGAAYHHGEFVNWDKRMLHDKMSATKSITSACIDIAIDHGFIESAHQSIFIYLPEHQHINIDGKGKQYDS